MHRNAGTPEGAGSLELERHTVENKTQVLETELGSSVNVTHVLTCRAVSPGSPFAIFEFTKVITEESFFFFTAKLKNLFLKI